MPDLNKKPPKYNLVLSKGVDLYIGFRHTTAVFDMDGNPVLNSEGKPTYEKTDYPEGSVVALTIDTTPPLVIPAEIDGSLATVWEQSEVVDLINPGKFWRAVITYANGVDGGMFNGKTTRSDG